MERLYWRAHFDFPNLLAHIIFKSYCKNRTIYAVNNFILFSNGYWNRLYWRAHFDFTTCYFILDYYVTTTLLPYLLSIILYYFDTAHLLHFIQIYTHYTTHLYIYTSIHFPLILRGVFRSHSGACPPLTPINPYFNTKL